MASDTIEVRNLPPGLDESMVSQFFAIYGTVTSCAIPKSTMPGKTSAVVSFKSADEATHVVNTLNGTVPAGLQEALIINIYTNAPVAPAVGNAEKGDNGSHTEQSNGAVANGGKFQPDDQAWGEPEISDNVYIEGLPAGTSEESAMHTFKEFGTVVSIKLMMKGPSVPCAAFVRFTDTAAAKLVKDILDGSQPDGFPCPLTVKFSNQSSMGNTPNGKGSWHSPPIPPPAVMPSWQKGAKMGDSWGPAFNAGKGFQNKGQGKGKGNGKSVDIDTLVDLIYSSDSLPGGQLFSDNACAVYCAGLPGDCSQWHLYKLFAPFGAIHSITVQGDGASSAVGFVQFLESHCANAACIAYNGMMLPTGEKMSATIQTETKS